MASLDDLKREIELLEKKKSTLKGLNIEYKEESDLLNSVKKNVSSLEREYKEVVAIQKLMTIKKRGNVNALTEEKEALRGLSEEQKKVVKKQADIFKKGGKGAKEYQAYVENLEESLGNLGEKMKDISFKFSKDTKIIKSAIKEIGDMSDKAGVNKVLQSIGLGQARGATRRVIAAPGATRERLKGYGTSLMEKGGMMGGSTGKMISKFGGAVSKFAGAAGVIAGVAAALATLVKVVNELDHFIKGLNKEFIKLAGPTIGGKAIMQMKEFNDSLFDVSRNNRLGLLSKEIQEMFGSMSGAGMSLQGVKKYIGDYGETVEFARKQSLKFGVSFSKMGEMIADQMLNFRSSLDEVNDSINTLSYGAQKAGINSERFYQAVESASSSLTFYGNYLQYVSGLVSKFTDQGVAGFKDATKVAGDLAGKFKDIHKNRQIVSIIGEPALKKILEEQVESTKKSISDVNKKIEDARKNGYLDLEKQLVEERKRLISQLGIPEAYVEGRVSGPQAAAEAMAYVQDPLKLIRAVLEGTGMDLMSKTGIESFTMLSKHIGISSEAILTLKNSVYSMTNQTMEWRKRMEKDQKGALKALTGDSKELVNVVSILKRVEKGDVALADVEDEIRSNLGAVPGITQDFMNEFIDIAGTLPEYLRAFIERKGAVGRGDARGMAYERLYKQTVVPTKGIGFDDKAQQELIAQTTEMSKYLDITAEGVKYALSGNDLLANISKWTYSAASTLTSWWRSTKRGESEKTVYLEKLKGKEEEKILAGMMASRTASRRQADISSRGLRIDYSPDLMKRMTDAKDTKELRQVILANTDYAEEEIKKSTKLSAHLENLTASIQNLNKSEKAIDKARSDYGVGKQMMFREAEKIAMAQQQDLSKKLVGVSAEESEKTLSNAVNSIADEVNNAVEEAAKKDYVTKKILNAAQEGIPMAMQAGGGVAPGMGILGNLLNLLPDRYDLTKKEEYVKKARESSGLSPLVPTENMSWMDFIDPNLAPSTAGSMLKGFLETSKGTKIENNWSMTFNVQGDVDKEAISAMKRSFEDSLTQTIRKENLGYGFSPGSE